MDHETRADWIRRLVVFVMIGGGIAAGIFLDLPGLGREPEPEKRESALKQVDPENFRETINEDNCLTALSMMLDGNPDAEKIAEILEQFEAERKYGDQVKYAELNISENPEMGKSQAVDLEKFAGQIDFYADGYKLGTLKGPTDAAQVEATIDRYLAGLVKRFGRGWLPEVEGMKSGSRKDQILNIQPADPVPPR